MTSVSTHVLDSVTGSPASGMNVELSQWAGEWGTFAHGVTDPDGRLRFEQSVAAGRYRLVFDTGSWFGDRPCFYPEVAIAFEVDEDRHYHVPLLLAPYAYSTYRGS